MNSPHFFDHLYSIIPLFCSLCPFLFFISLTLLSPPVFPYLHWPSVCLSVRVWIIEVYWVWSADGEMAVMDLSVLFRKCWVYADTCAVKVRRSVAEAPNTTGGSTPIGHAQKWYSSSSTCACSHMQVQIYNTLSHSNLCLSTHNLTCGRTRESKSKQTLWWVPLLLQTILCTCHNNREGRFQTLLVISRRLSHAPFYATLVVPNPQCTTVWEKTFKCFSLHFLQFHNTETRGNYKNGWTQLGHCYLQWFFKSLKVKNTVKKKSAFSVGITANKCTVSNPHSKWLPASQSSRQQVVEVSHWGFYTYYM